MHKKLRRSLLTALVLLSCLPGFAQQPAIQTNDDLSMAPVVVDGVTLFEVRGISFYSAEKRAAAVAQAICQIAQDPAIDPGSVLLTPSEGRVEITCGKYPICTLLESEARQERLTVANYGLIVKEQIAGAIKRYRHDRESAVLRGKLLLAAGLAVAGLLLLWLVFRLSCYLNRFINSKVALRLRDVQIQSVQIVRRQHIWSALQFLLRLTEILLAILVSYLFLYEILHLFPWTRGLSDSLLRQLVAPLRVIIGGGLSQLPNLFFLTVLFVIVRFAMRLVKTIFQSIESGQVKIAGFETEWALPTYRLTRLLIIAFALVVAYPYIPGSSSEAFKGFSVFFGVLISLGASSLVGNVIAGYSVTYRRAFRVGDRIKAGEHVGEVREIRLMATRLRTLKNEEVTIPNAKLIGDEVLNYSALAGRLGLVLHTRVGIGYEVPWRQVEAMLLEAARATGGVQHDRAFVLLKELGDFAVVYELNVPCAEPARMEALYSELHRNILDAFNKYGVQIMTPAYEGDTSDPKIVAPARWFAAPAVPPKDPQPRQPG